MSTIVTRAGKGSALTHNEVDANFTNLNTDKVEKTGTDPVVISVNSASDALRITQIGAGNALVVEDSANPDATPFVIDASGNLIKGRDSQVAFSATTPGTLLASSTLASVNLGQLYYANNGSAPFLLLGKSRGTAVAPFTVVNSGDNIGSIQFEAADGTGLIQAANITAAVDGTPGTGDMPGRLVFSTTADGDSTPTPRMRIDSSGNVGIGTTAPAVKLEVSSATGSATPTPTEIRIATTTVASDYSTTLPWGRLSFYSADTSDTGPKIQGSIDAISDAAAGGRMSMVFSTSAATTGTLTERMRIDNAGLVTLSTTSGLSIGRASVTSPAATDGNVFSGTYTPALTNTTNITSSTPATCQYMRVGSVVTVSGTVTIDPTATGRIVMGMTLPIASNFAVSTPNQCGGTFASSGTTTVNVGSIAADGTNDRATFDGVVADAASRVYAFSFTYLVI